MPRTRPAKPEKGGGGGEKAVEVINKEMTDSCDLQPSKDFIEANSECKSYFGTFTSITMSCNIIVRNLLHSQHVIFSLVILTIKFYLLTMSVPPIFTIPIHLLQ